ncbi:MAG: hypothetical protein ABIQ95_08915, partial [Bdellovibrionia bacterium]
GPKVNLWPRNPNVARVLGIQKKENRRNEKLLAAVLVQENPMGGVRENKTQESKLLGPGTPENKLRAREIRSGEDPVGK